MDKKEEVFYQWQALSECIKKHWGERHDAPVYQYNKLVAELDKFEIALFDSIVEEPLV